MGRDTQNELPRNTMLLEPLGLPHKDFASFAFGITSWMMEFNPS